MSRDKQIEEFYELLTRDCETSCCECKFDRLDLCLPHRKAEVLYNAGYRKSTDVAEEIFAEIDELLSPYGSYIKTIDIHEYIELKKKYTEN